MAPMPLAITLFGTLEVQDADGQRALFRGTKSGALLAYLALQPGKAISREVIADALWEEGDSETLRNRLRQELSTQRKQLREAGIAPDLLLDTPRDTAQVRADSVTTDVARYWQLLERAKRETDTTTIVRCLSEAAAFYSGPLLNDFDEVWIRTEREHLTNQHTHTLRELSLHRQVLGDARGAKESLNALLALDPMREEVHADLMRLYASQGQPSLVLKQYRELERVLREDFEVAPSEAMQRLAEEPREQAAANSHAIAVPASLPPPGAAPSAPSHPPRTTPVAPVSQNGVKPERNGHKLPARKTPSFLSLILRSRYFAFLAACCLVVGCIFWVHQRASKELGKALRPVWTKEYHIQTDEKDNAEGTAVATDADGNVYVCGMIQTDHEDVDILTMKYTPEGKPDWSHRFSGPGHDCDRPFAITVDGSGVFVAGETYVPKGMGDIKEGWHLITLKYSPKGEGPKVEYSPVTIEDRNRVCMVRDGEGGVYVGGTELRSGNSQAMLILHYSRSGERLWCKRIETPRGSRLKDIAALGTGGVLVCGEKQREGKEDATWDGLVACIDYNSTPRWQLPISVTNTNSANSCAERILVDGKGNIYVGGNGNFQKMDATERDTAFWLARITSGGGILWRSACRSPAPVAEVHGLVTTGEGVTLCGRADNWDRSWELVALSCDATGKSLWSQQIEQQDRRSAEVNALVALDTGPVIVGQTYMPTKNGASVTQQDILVQQLSRTGRLFSQSVYNAPSDQNEFLRAAAVYRDPATGKESLYVTGQFGALSDHARLSLLKFSSD